MAGDAAVKSVLVQDKVFIHFISQDAIEKITNVSIGRELGHVRIRRVLARCRHHGADCHVARLRTEDLGKVFEEAETIDDAIGFAFFVYDWRDPACTAGKHPCHAKLRFGADAIEPLHDRLKAWRGVGEQYRRFEPELLQHPGRLGIERPCTGCEGIYPVALAQEPGIPHRRGDGVGIRVDMSDHKGSFLHKYYFLSLRVSDTKSNDKGNYILPSFSNPRKTSTTFGSE